MKTGKREQIDNGTDNDIGDEGAKKISESLKINTTLMELDLSGDNKIVRKENRKRGFDEVDNEQ